MGVPMMSGIVLPVHRLPGICTIPSAELVTLVDWSLTALLKGNEHRGLNTRNISHLAQSGGIGSRTPVGFGSGTASLAAIVVWSENSRTR